MPQVDREKRTGYNRNSESTVEGNQSCPERKVEMKYSYLERHSFFHLLFVYAVFLLLMLLLMLPILNRASRALEESVVASYTTEIARNTARIDEQMDSFISIVSKIVNGS